jgi:hypothetical protein
MSSGRSSVAFFSEPTPTARFLSDENTNSDAIRPHQSGGSCATRLKQTVVAARRYSDKTLSHVAVWSICADRRFRFLSEPGEGGARPPHAAQSYNVHSEKVVILLLVQLWLLRAVFALFSEAQFV